eukprot:1114981-Rhodomonas_salina.1
MHAWLGLTDAAVEGSPEWPPDADPLGLYANWATSSPPNDASTNCVAADGGDGWAWSWTVCESAAASPMCSRTWPTGVEPVYPGAEDLVQRAQFCHLDTD